MKYERPFDNHGLTMVEMLMAITIIAILVLPLVGLLSSQLRRDERTIDSQLGLSAARQYMDRALSPEILSSMVQDDSLLVTVNGRQWVVVTDPVNGQQFGEPANGTEPLEIRVRVYSPGTAQPMVSLTALKGR